MCSTLEPLYCSSFTTAVGGTTDTNFVDSAHPTVARIRGSQGFMDTQGDNVEVNHGIFGEIYPKPHCNHGVAS